jgi:tRNA(Ile)-lysidine synthase
MDAPARALLDLLAGQNPPPSIAIAYSGGRDSSVLLHAAAGLQRAGRTGPLRALHVDHGLHPDASRWRDHCAAHCTRLGVAFDTVSVDARPASGESPEAAARTARYTALAGLLRPGEWLLTAHHRDDQAETLLLQLLRGAGIAGLAAMPARTPFAGGWLARPLLDLGRNDLAAYAARHALEWCEDPGNAAVEHDRNYLRHAVLPRLEERWPAVAQCLGRSAAHCAEAAGLLDELAAGDLAAAGVLPGTSTLPLTALRALPSARRRLLLRHWLAGLGLPLPGRRVLARVETEMLGAAPDRNPCIAWPGAELRRYRDLLHARRPPPGVVDRVMRSWDPAGPLELPWGTLRVRPVPGAGIDRAHLEGAEVTVTTRAGGERLRLPGRPTRPLKKLLQEAEVPPWHRTRLPLVWVNGTLAAVADLWVAAEFAADPGAPGLRLEWQDLADTQAAEVNDLD